jgi:hypothetical protein
MRDGAEKENGRLPREQPAGRCGVAQSLFALKALVRRSGPCVRVDLRTHHVLAIEVVREA